MQKQTAKLQASQLQLIDLYEQEYPNPGAEIQARIQAIDLEFIREDLVQLMNSMQVGITQKLKMEGVPSIFNL